MEEEIEVFKSKILEVVKEMTPEPDIKPPETTWINKALSLIERVKKEGKTVYKKIKHLGGVSDDGWRYEPPSEELVEFRVLELPEGVIEVESKFLKKKYYTVHDVMAFINYDLPRPLKQEFKKLIEEERKKEQEWFKKVKEAREKWEQENREAFKKIRQLWEELPNEVKEKAIYKLGLDMFDAEPTPEMLYNWVRQG